MQVRSLAREDPLEKGMATHSSILAWRIPWTETWRVTVHEAAENQTHCCWNPPSMRLCKLFLVTVPGREGKERGGGRKDRIGWGGRQGPQRRKKGKGASVNTHPEQSSAASRWRQGWKPGAPVRNLMSNSRGCGLVPDGIKWQCHPTFWLDELSWYLCSSFSFTKRKDFLWTPEHHLPNDEQVKLLDERSPSDVFSVLRTHCSAPHQFICLLACRCPDKLFSKGFFLSPPAVLSKGSTSSLVTLCACVVPVITLKC